MLGRPLLASLIPVPLNKGFREQKLQLLSMMSQAKLKWSWMEMIIEVLAGGQYSLSVGHPYKAWVQ
jgi:hypothetical protein